MIRNSRVSDSRLLGFAIGYETPIGFHSCLPFAGTCTAASDRHQAVLSRIAILPWQPTRHRPHGRTLISIPIQKMKSCESPN